VRLIIVFRDIIYIINILYSWHLVIYEQFLSVCVEQLILSMQHWSINIWYLSNSLTNKVVNIILISKSKHYESWISTGWQQEASIIHFWECWGDLSQFTPCKGTIWQHDTHGLGDPTYGMSSTWYLSEPSVGGPYTILVYITTGMVRCRPTQWPSALLTCSPVPSDTSLIDWGRGYHLWSSKHKNTPLIAIPIWYSPLSTSCPVQSQFHATFWSLKEIQS
jgi:hypothetical protein